MNFINDILPHELVNSIGWTLLHSIWQATAIAEILLIILFALRKKTSQIRYLSAILAMLTILCLSAITFCYYYLTSDTTAMGNKTIQEVTALFSVQSSELTSEDKNLNQTIVPFIENNINLQKYLPVFVSIWFIGIFLFSFKFAGGFFYAQRIKTYKTQVLPVNWQKRIKPLCKKLNINKPVHLLQSSFVRIPTVIGFLKPVILLPASMITGIPADQLETIIIHELAHIYRRDYLFNILQSFVEIIFFFHPVVWWISTTMRIEREHSCDDIVVKVSNNSLNYAKALAEMETKGLLSKHVAVALLHNKNTLINRIKRLIEPSKSTTNFSTGFISAIVIVITIIAVALSSGNNNISFQDKYENTTSNLNLLFDYSDEWWFPIIKKHNLELRAFSNYTHVLETGSTNQINKTERIILDAIIIINADNDYLILSSPKVVYSFDDSTYRAKDVNLSRFLKKVPSVKPKEKVLCKKLSIKLLKSVEGSPSFLITNLDKPEPASSNYKWMPKKFSEPDSLITEPIKDKHLQKSILSGEWKADIWESGDSIAFGSNIIFKMWHGVELEANNLRFNKRTEIFESGALKFLILENKVIINFLANIQGKYSYTANEIYKEGRFIRLLGNAYLSTPDTKIKANEIIIDVTI